MHFQTNGSHHTSELKSWITSALDPKLQGSILTALTLLLPRKETSFCLDLRHLQLAQLLQLLYLLNRDHVADLQRLHVTACTIAHSLQRLHNSFFALHLPALQTRILK